MSYDFCIKRCGDMFAVFNLASSQIVANTKTKNFAEVSNFAFMANSCPGKVVLGRDGLYLDV